MTSPSPNAIACAAELIACRLDPHSRFTVDARNFDRQSGEQHRHARDVAIVFAALIGGAEVHVVDLRARSMPVRSTSARIACGGEIVGTHRCQRAAVAADRRAHRIDHPHLARSPRRHRAGPEQVRLLLRRREPRASDAARTPRLRHRRDARRMRVYARAADLAAPCDRTDRIVRAQPHRRVDVVGGGDASRRPAITASLTIDPTTRPRNSPGTFSTSTTRLPERLRRALARAPARRRRRAPRRRSRPRSATQASRERRSRPSARDGCSRGARRRRCRSRRRRQRAPSRRRAASRVRRRTLAAVACPVADVDHDRRVGEQLVEHLVVFDALHVHVALLEQFGEFVGASRRNRGSRRTRRRLRSPASGRDTSRAFRLTRRRNRRSRRRSCVPAGLLRPSRRCSSGGIETRRLPVRS